MKYELIKPIESSYTPIQQILTNRGIKLEDIPHYLNVSEKDNLSPLILNNIESAAKILIQHISDPNAKIYVQVDADYDGFSSASLLLNYVYAQFPSAIEKFTYGLHDGKIHGIDIDNIPEGTTLVIAPDASSNEISKHQRLKEKGIDVLVLDHHLADEVSKYACVVNNQLCDYPTKSLSGVGIVYKLCQYLDIITNHPIADNYLDLVATGLVGDMVSLQDFETRYLVNQGLQRSALRNPFIAGMAEKNAFNLGQGDLTPMGVAFYIVPLANAVTRVGTLAEKQIVFESMLEYEAHKLVPSTKRGCAGQQETKLEQSLRTCTNVKNRQGREQDKAVEQIETIIKKENLDSHKVIIVKLEQLNFDRSLIGLVANKTMAKYQRPICILVKDKIRNLDGEEEIVWRGSLRACGVENFRKFCEDSNLVNYAEGHASAAGLSISDDCIDVFQEFCDNEFKDKDFSPNYKVDFIYSVSDIRPRDILEIGDMKSLWGQSVEEPMLAVEHIAVTKDMITLMSRNKNPTLKIQLPNGVSCIKFKSSEEEFESLYSDSGCVVINAVGRAEVNRYLDNVTPQLIINDYEIINRQEYYF